MKIEYKEGELLEFNENGDTKLFGLDYTEMVYVEKGTFNIGDNNSGIENEKEATITFNNSYFIGKYPVTQEFYEYIKGENPSHFKGKYKPVEMVSWNDIYKGVDSFLKQLNNKLKEEHPSLNGKFSLPSEAQWEYAARGGKAWDNPDKFLYAGSNNIHDVSWFDENSNAQTMPVGLKQPNRLGVYDMSGNIFEWCIDNYVEDYQKIPNNGEAYQQSATMRVLRGGRWYDQVEFCRVAFRKYYYPDRRIGSDGFRLVFLPV
ncbi:formylglycine-generating enzyme family protein [Arcicella rigui]|uniref:Formylglycine-generating enzyme family protein n=1 Tax=Arcicella rigui TaxID=797020 RepID=A0ABU5QDI3_9BACT|nr:formylglycine-generating enzyme family protein [Arcicella rigui]MEA5140668.1 formylglycine-generating enzyme family protein [Arcicella rigui]